MKGLSAVTHHSLRGMRCWLPALLAPLLLMGIAAPAYSQQFNSDNWWVVPHGSGTFGATFGQNYNLLFIGYGFADKWEVDYMATLYETDQEDTTTHYSTTAYVKRLLYENEAHTGGVALMAGIGQSPSYLQSDTITRNLESYWATFAVTVPFFDNRLSWDIMPGVLYDHEYGAGDESATGLTYSTRLALYDVIPQSAIVAEVFGTEGDIASDPQYKVGVRWESKAVIIALTYGAGFDGSDGGGIELGMIVLTPSFF